jgi:type IV pilus assembly protein PilV
VTPVRRLRGYTAVELLMAIAVLAIGVSGIIAMQKITVASNHHSRNLALATQIARAWQDQLATDALQWNHPSPSQPNIDLNETSWLASVGATSGNGSGWLRPTWDIARDFGPAFDALGNPIDLVGEGDIQQARFCVDLRLSWLFPPVQGNGLIRSEVRVFWPRSGGLVGVPLDFCDGSTNPPAQVSADTSNYHFVYLTTSIKQNPPPQ